MNKPLYEIIERPVITEKSVKESARGRYTFRCKTAANKIEIKAAVEAAFEVKVSAVNTLIVKGKTKQVGKARKGRTADWKKAVITLVEGDKAARLKEIFEGA
jgi:large subunit ribosomal protein L23